MEPDNIRRLIKQEVTEQVRSHLGTFMQPRVCPHCGGHTLCQRQERGEPGGLLGPKKYNTACRRCWTKANWEKEPGPGEAVVCSVCDGTGLIYVGPKVIQIQIQT